MMSLGDCTLWVQWEHWLPVPVPREDTVCTVRGLYPAACRLLGLVALFVGDARSSTLRLEAWCRRLGRLSGSWLSGRDSMHPLSWPCSVGVRNSFPSLCRTPVFLLPLRVSS